MSVALRHTSGVPIFANGAKTAAIQYLFNQVGSSSKEGGGFFKRMWRKATGWHFEGRHALNSNLPTFDQANSDSSLWTELPEEQSIFHDNGVGNKELKYIHPDGREVIYNGDTLTVMQDSKYMGTYNYVNPAPTPNRWYNLKGWGAYVGKGIGHVVVDVIPYGMGGNVRGAN